MIYPFNKVTSRQIRQSITPRLSMVLVFVLIFSAAYAPAQTTTVNSTAKQYSRYTVVNNPPQDIAPRLKAVLGDFGFKVDIFIDEANSTLAVQGDPQVHQMVGQLLKTLDKKPTKQARQTAVNTIHHPPSSKIIPPQRPYPSRISLVQHIHRAYGAHAY